jgi:flagellar hook-basal body complex protein FliE
MAVHAAGTAGILREEHVTSRAGHRQSNVAEGFAESLGRLIETVDDSAREANGAVGNMLNKTGEVHDAMIALHHAETALQLTVQIRNKLVQAYQEVMRMPI